MEHVDEVDNDNDVTNHRNAGGASASGEFTYDNCFAVLPPYYDDLEDTHNRRPFLDGGAVLNIYILYLEGVVLFPEATLPLRVIQPYSIAAVEKAWRQIDGPYTIGVVRLYRDYRNKRIKFSTTGTTAEIRQYRLLEDGSVNFVALGQQRFQLRRRWIDVEGAPCGEIQIIQEDLPLRTPRDAVGELEPLKNVRSGSTLQRPSLNGSAANQRGCGDGDDSGALSEESFEKELSALERRLHHSARISSYGYDMAGELTSSDKEKVEQVSECRPEKSHLDNYMGALHTVECNIRFGHRGTSNVQSFKRLGWEKFSVSRLRKVPRAFWPNWVYQLYDSYYLAQRAADRWKQIIQVPSMDWFVMKPDLLSFHIASRIPVSVSTRQELLEIDGISYRLRREIELLESFDHIRCTCKSLIARRSDMLVMSRESLGAYVNQHGYLHEVIALHKANGLAVVGTPLEHYSWFPGYESSVAECVTCKSPLGWLFTATTKTLKPRSFWGLRTSLIRDDTH